MQRLVTNVPAQRQWGKNMVKNASIRLQARQRDLDFLKSPTFINSRITFWQAKSAV